MNDDGIHDPELQGLEAQLAGLPPRVSAQAHDELLYACGFAAGRRAASANLRVWKAVAAGLLVCAVGLTVPLMREPGRDIAAGPAPAESSQPVDAVDQPRDAAPVEPYEPHEPTSIARSGASTPLDAWQVPDGRLERLDQELARYRTADPDTQSLAVTNLRRALLDL